MTFSRSLAAFGFLSLLVISGCRKYDQNGSLLHFRTPESRLIGTWTSAEVTQIGTADTNTTEFMASSNLLLEAVFTKEGQVTITNVNDALVYEGLWEFNDDKSVLHLDELTFTKVTGPFYTDAAGMDQTPLVQSVFDFLQGTSDCSDTLFFATDSHMDMTEEVFNCFEGLTATGSNWVLSDGTLNYNGGVFQAGDVINDAMLEYIEGFVDDELLDEACGEEWTQDCINEIVGLTLQDYGATVEYVEISSPAVSGWDDPALFSALNENCELDVYRFDAAPINLNDPAVLGYLADNAEADLDCNGMNEPLGLALEEEFVTEVKVLDLYWEMLELELDDMQAQQFREYDGETIVDFNFLLRFEKQD